MAEVDPQSVITNAQDRANLVMNYGNLFVASNLSGSNPAWMSVHGNLQIVNKMAEEPDIRKALSFYPAPPPP